MRRGVVWSGFLLGVLVVGFPAARAVAQPFEPCEPAGVQGRALCGTVTVPEDRARPDGRQIDIGVVVLPATVPDPEPDPVVFFIGGPGGPSTVLARRVSRNRSGPLASRDLVFFDERGTGASNSLTCEHPPGVAHFFGNLYPEDDALRECLDRVSKRADPRFYTTTASADDLDTIRRALGYEKLNLNGGSYGTRLSLVYLRRHPETVRTLQLTGVVPVDFRAPLMYARYAQEALNHLFHDCLEDAECQEAYPNVRREWKELLGGLRDQPAPVRVPDRDTGGTVRVRFSADDLAYTARSMLYGAQALELPAMIHRAHATGDLAPFAEAYADRADGLRRLVSDGHHLSVFCAEDVSFFDEDEARDATEGTFLDMYLIREYRRACRIWPRGEIPEGYHEPIRSDAPVLIISGRRDPSTPPATGEHVMPHLSNAVHLVHRWGGHAFPGTPDTFCEQRISERFLETGSTEGLDLSCVENEKPLPFEGTDRSPARPRDVIR